MRHRQRSVGGELQPARLGIAGHHLGQAGLVDGHLAPLQEHWIDHRPDQPADRQVDLDDFHAADGLEGRGEELAKRDADDDAEVAQTIR